MKTAKYQVDAVTILCPHCGDPWPAPDGGLLHAIDNSLHWPRRAGAPAKCPSCGLKFGIPTVPGIYERPRSR